MTKKNLFNRHIVKDVNHNLETDIFVTKYFKIRTICFIVFILLSNTIFSQEVKPDSVLQKPKSYGELSYEFMVAPGYGHIWNIKDKVRLGTAFHVGFGKALLFDYSDFFMLRFFARDLFGVNKKNKPAKYDLGFFSSLSFQNEAIFYGITFCYYFNLSNRFRIGLDSHFGRYKTDDSNGWAGYIMPGIYFKLRKRLI